MTPPLVVVHRDAALLAKADGNDRLSEKLREIMSNTELLKKVGEEAGVTGAEGVKADG